MIFFKLFYVQVQRQSFSGHQHSNGYVQPKFLTWEKQLSDKFTIRFSVQHIWPLNECSFRFLFLHFLMCRVLLSPDWVTYRVQQINCRSVNQHHFLQPVSFGHDIHLLSFQRIGASFPWTCSWHWPSSFS